MDALTEVLKAMQLHSTVHCRSEFSAPWGLRIDQSYDAAFHVILQGNCWLEIDQYGSVRAERYEFPVCRDVACNVSTKVDGRSILLTEPY
jgi:Cupin